MEVQGIINLLKPAGMTSHDGVYFLRKLTGIKKIGHTGTLDPMAAGVLPICIGNATKIIDYLDLDEKEYRCEMILGIETDTYDIWGKVLNDQRYKVSCIDETALTSAFNTFIGEIYQLPPNYSSVRVQGKHLYEYARKGQEVSVKPRPVIIHNLKILRFDGNTGRVMFDIACSKGTYIRSICHEAGKILKCGGAMSFLARISSGSFKIENSVTMDALSEEWSKHLLPMDFPLGHLGKLFIRSERVGWFSNGGYLRLNETDIERHPVQGKQLTHIKTREGLERAYNVYCGERFLGIVNYDAERNLFVVDKVFSR